MKRFSLLKIMFFITALAIILLITFGITIPVTKYGLELMRTGLFFEVILGICVIVGVAVISSLIDFQICKTTYKQLTKI